MKAYKGFKRHDDGTLWCKDFQYEPGKTYKYEGNIALCESGFHACHELHQVWCFYSNNGTNVFYEVECGGDIIDPMSSNGKFVCSEIRLVKKVDIKDVAKFEYAWFSPEGFAKVRLKDKWNFIDTTGKLLSEQWYDEAWDFTEGFAKVVLDGKFNHIDTKGKLLSKQWYDWTRCFYEGFAPVKLDGKWNHIDNKGKLMSEKWYDYAFSFSEGFARVKLNGKWLTIDTEGKIVG